MAAGTVPRVIAPWAEMPALSRAPARRSSRTRVPCDALRMPGIGPLVVNGVTIRDVDPARLK
jgi:hypothetical protein